MKTQKLKQQQMKSKNQFSFQTNKLNSNIVENIVENEQLKSELNSIFSFSSRSSSFASTDQFPCSAHQFDPSFNSSIHDHDRAHSNQCVQQHLRFTAQPTNN
jgi:hypothetical protein